MKYRYTDPETGGITDCTVDFPRPQALIPIIDDDGESLGNGAEGFVGKPGKCSRTIFSASPILGVCPIQDTEKIMELGTAVHLVRSL